MQFVFAGKAHPADTPGKELIQRIEQFARQADVRHRFVFLADYDISIARAMYHGCDVWLNTPRRPLEACGTQRHEGRAQRRAQLQHPRRLVGRVLRRRRTAGPSSRPTTTPTRSAATCARRAACSGSSSSRSCRASTTAAATASRASGSTMVLAGVGVARAAGDRVAHGPRLHDRAVRAGRRLVHPPVVRRRQGGRRAGGVADAGGGGLGRRGGDVGRRRRQRPPAGASRHRHGGRRSRRPDTGRRRASRRPRPRRPRRRVPLDRRSPSCRRRASSATRATSRSASPAPTASRPASSRCTPTSPAASTWAASRGRTDGARSVVWNRPDRVDAKRQVLLGAVELDDGEPQQAAGRARARRPSCTTIGTSQPNHSIGGLSSSSDVLRGVEVGEDCRCGWRARRRSPG